jgi:hypothetical protein
MQLLYFQHITDREVVNRPAFVYCLYVFLPKKKSRVPHKIETLLLLYSRIPHGYLAA